MPHRIDWVDYAKGICIILVVMMHSVLGVEKALGQESWMGGFIAWAKPFRMPDFFLISGLFLASRIARPWREYLDSKVWHFAYFYVLWLTIQSALKAPGLYAEGGLAAVLGGYATGFIQPYGTLWFIYLLAVFFVAAKLLRHAPPLLVLAAAALLEIAPVETGSLLIDEFAARFVYFYAGYIAADLVFRFAAGVAARKPLIIFCGLVIWGFGNAALVTGGWSGLPGLGLGLGFIGAAAVVSAGVLLSKFRLAGFIRHCGERSIVIYLGFVLFMGPARAILLKAGIPSDPGTVGLIVTAVSVAGALALHRLVRGTPLAFLFRRPRFLQKNRTSVAPIVMAAAD